MEAPEQLGRGERHGGIWKENLSRVVKVHRIVGKKDMKVAAAVVVNAKNEYVRKGGLAPIQWVLGKYPRGVACLMEEEEMGQLGALENALDPSTEFGRRSAYRLTSRKHFVKMDCSRRYMRAQCRNAGTMPVNARTGDMLMYKKEQGSSGAPGELVRTLGCARSR